ncbi:FAD binding domain-containing protein [Aestuariibius sp. 2305UL40-4]|uniref:FAD binding domain-containing protein n=1 Tax=Aestuariibius violaceus TaxID=3234132 RepID=UPI00345E8AE4
MREFEILRASTPSDVFATLSRVPDAKLIAGGTNLVDLMKLGVEQPATLVDINGLGELNEIVLRDDGSLHLGALVGNSDVAWHKEVRARFPMVSEAILAGATTQLRNMATIGGNLLQKNRCPYFADLDAGCNKRAPGTGCDAIEGTSRMCAVLGVSDDCIAAHPSDLCVALAALGAVVHVSSADGERQIPFAEFHRRPGQTPWIETDLGTAELITAVEIPNLNFARRSIYKKLRDRTSYAFALVSVAAAVEMDAGRIGDLRLALGGVGTVPWRASEAEDALRGTKPTKANLTDAAHAIFVDAQARKGNAFKIELAQRAIVRVLTELTKD